MKKEYSSSVFCNCFKKSKNIDLYGDFWYATGACPVCGRVYIARQIPTGNGHTRYEIEKQETLKSIVGEWVTLLT